MEDGFNLEAEECEFYYIKTLKMMFLYTSEYQRLLLIKDFINNI